MGFKNGMSRLYGYRLYVTGSEEIRDGFLSAIEDPGFTGCNDTHMKISVSRPKLTAAGPSPERQNLTFEYRREFVATGIASNLKERYTYEEYIF
jgi:hypothetical protein